MPQPTQSPPATPPLVAPQVRALATRLGVPSGAAPRTVRLVQTGYIRGEGRAGWLPFRARQTIAVGECGFTWSARIGPLGLIGVRDRLGGGEGELSVKALGIIPLAHTRSSPTLVRGELMRYLAELAWAPDAIVHNPALRWHEAGADRLVVGAGRGESAAEITLTLDAEGRIASAFAPDRPKSVGETFVATPWRGRFADYRRHQGRWLPFRAEAAWVEGESEDVYWRGDIRTWQAFAGGA